MSGATGTRHLQPAAAERADPVNRMASESLLGAVDTDALMQHVREFARRVKLSGTPEERESFRYLQICMEEYGYRTTLLLHDAYISLPGSSRVDCRRTTPAKHHPFHVSGHLGRWNQCGSRLHR